MRIRFQDAPSLLADGDRCLEIGVPVGNSSDARALVGWLIDAVPYGWELFTIIRHG
jgi:hypothetical protein